MARLARAKSGRRDIVYLLSVTTRDNSDRDRDGAIVGAMQDVAVEKESLNCRIICGIELRESLQTLGKHHPPTAFGFRWVMARKLF